MKTTLKSIILALVVVTVSVAVTGCAENGDKTVNVKNGFEQISPEQAKELMDSETDYVILDVRTAEEYAGGHIENAVLIPDYELEARAESELSDKERLILVYCRSGRRSKLAAQTLADLGYTKVKEFGGIIDWPYETVK